MEALRAKNIEDNRRILKELGIYSSIAHKRVVQTKKPRVSVKRKADCLKSDSEWKPDESGDYGSEFSGKRRRSSRLRNVKRKTRKVRQDRAREKRLKHRNNTGWENAAERRSPADELPLQEPDEEEEVKRKTPATPRPNSFGAIPGVEVGRTWDYRLQASADGIHRPTVAGIHGCVDGAYSLALSGGYEDDIDLGLSFTYTGEGGRDLKGTKANPKNLRTAPQSKDQTLTRGNFALSRNLETGNPVRVIRGFKLDSPFAPEDCYRYDGLYAVQKCWFTKGMSGHMVWKFALSRLEDQAPPPWEIVDINNNESKSDEETSDIKAELDVSHEEGIKEEVKNSDEENPSTSIKTEQDTSPEEGIKEEVKNSDEENPSTSIKTEQDTSPEECLR